MNEHQAVVEPNMDEQIKACVERRLADPAATTADAVSEAIEKIIEGWIGILQEAEGVSLQCDPRLDITYGKLLLGRAIDRLAHKSTSELEFRCEGCGQPIVTGQPYNFDEDGIRWHKHCPSPERVGDIGPLIDLFRGDESEWGSKCDHDNIPTAQAAVELIQHLRNESDFLREQITGIERQLGIEPLCTTKTIGLEIERLLSIERQSPNMSGGRESGGNLQIVPQGAVRGQTLGSASSGVPEERPVGPPDISQARRTQ